MNYSIFTERVSIKTRLTFLVVVIILLIAAGTVFYHDIEGWSYIDSFYFAAISLSTRGYGEFHPTTAVSKIFTVGYLFLGTAFILYTLSNFIGYFIKYHEPRIQRKMSRIVNTISPPKKEEWIVIKPKKREEEFPFPVKK